MFSKQNDSINKMSPSSSSSRRDDPMRSFPKTKTTSSELNVAIGTTPNPHHLAPQMRFKGIQPGPEWDGVDRGNGFELRVIREILKRR